MKIKGLKIKGGALQFTVVFSLLTIMMLMLFLSFTKLGNLEIFQAQRQSQLISNIQSVVCVLENAPDLFSENSFSLPILDEEGYSTEINISPWGFYDIVSVSSLHGRVSLNKVFLFADNIQKNESIPSLYLSSPNRYLSVGGKTYLGKNCYLPVHGIRKAYVGGIGYYRDSLTFGRVFVADNKLPEVNRRLNERYNLVKALAMNSANKVDITDLSDDTIRNSFTKEPLVVVCPDDFFISHRHFSGNIVITGTSFTIDNTVSIDNCIICADIINVGTGFTGNAQFFADKSLTVESMARLTYPSILYLDNTNAELIHIGDSLRLHGDIIIPNYTDNANEVLKTGVGSQIAGQIYCNGFSLFQGALFGSLYTRGFIFRDRRGNYQNYLVDVCIDIARLPREYNGISLTNVPSPKSCIDELY